MQQNDKVQLETKSHLSEVKKKLLDSQTEIVKLHCKLQETVSSSKTAQSEIEQLKRCNEQMQGKGIYFTLFRVRSNIEYLKLTFTSANYQQPKASSENFSP